MKKIFFATFALLSSFALTSCDEDYNEGLMPPMTSQPETPQTVAFGDGAVTTVPTIDLAEVEGDMVKVCNVTAPTVTDENASFAGYTLTLAGTALDMTENGEVSRSEIAELVEGIYGKRPVERELKGVVRCFYTNNGQSAVTVSDSITVKLIPEAPEIEAAYYLTGTINGWDNGSTLYKLTNDGSDPYVNPNFTCRIPAPDDGSDIEFKMTPESMVGTGDWSKCLAAADEGTFAYNNAGGNMRIAAVEGAVYYDLQFDMLAMTWSATALLIDIEPAYYLTGTINGWDNGNTDYKMTNRGGDPYSDPTFTLRIPAPVNDEGENVEVKFKMTPESMIGTGDWSKCLAAGPTTGTFAYNNAGGDIVIEAVQGAKYYDLTFNMMELTWFYQAVAFEPYIYEAGVNNGWGDVLQPLYCADGQGVYTGFFYAKEDSWTGGLGAFKFRGAADNWNEGSYGAGTYDDNGGTLVDSQDSGNLFATPGFYRADVNMGEMTYTLTRINSVFVVGSAVNNDWDNGVEMTYNTSELCWECDVVLGEGVIKFKGNGTWDNADGNWGGTMDHIVNGSNDNIPVSVTGNVHIKFYPLCDNMAHCTIEAN